MEIEIRGGPEFKAASARLKALTTASQNKRLRKAIVEKTDDAADRVRNEVPLYLPVGGGYAATVAESLRFTTSVLATGVRVKVTARGKSHPRQLANLERGGLRAPSRRIPRAYSRYKWHSQSVLPHFFTGPIDRMNGEIRDNIVKAMQEIADEIVG